MKIRVIEPFRDVAFNNTITRNVGDIIDTTKDEFKCSIDLAQERIRRGFCELVEEEKVEEIKEEPKKGKKVSKKK